MGRVNFAELPNTVIAPSILSADFRNLARDITRVEEAGADWLHLDVMDGHFVPNISFGPMVVGFVKKITDLYLDAHLMIEHPERYLEAFKKAGADNITLHAEVSGVIPEQLRRIKKMGLDAGISINPESPVDILEGAYDLVDLILIMSVHPGFGGQSFIADALLKVEQVAKRVEASGRPILIQIDGGIDAENAARIRKAGARVLVAGSSIFSAPDPAAAVSEIRTAADSVQ
jgi:ribulose-phosphate 3-epimerase